jgi:hypothetical protein
MFPNMKLWMYYTNFSSPYQTLQPIGELHNMNSIKNAERRKELE